MSVLKSLAVMSIIVTVLAVAAMVQLVIALLPYLAAALVVVLVLRWRRAGAPATSVTPPAVLIRPGPQPGDRGGAPAAAPEGWVMVPVWVAPRRPDPIVVDAEGITDRD
jgi:hypothetical protein